MQNIHLLFIIAFVCLSVPHTVIAYFDAAIFSIKQFSFIYFIISVVRQRDEHRATLSGMQYEPLSAGTVRKLSHISSSMTLDACGRD